MNIFLSKYRKPPCALCVFLGSAASRPADNKVQRRERNVKVGNEGRRSCCKVPMEVLTLWVVVVMTVYDGGWVICPVSHANVTFSKWKLLVGVCLNSALCAVTFCFEKKPFPTWRGKLESQESKWKPVYPNRVFSEVLQRKLVTKGGKLTHGGVKITDYGKTQGVLSYSTEMWHLLSRQTRTVSLSSCVTWMASNCWLPWEKQIRSVYITSRDWSQPPLSPSPISSTLSLCHNILKLFSGYMTPECSKRSSGPKDKPISSKPVFNTKALLFIGRKYILCYSSAHEEAW